jgi:hypothetical protein
MAELPKLSDSGDTNCRLAHQPHEQRATRRRGLTNLPTATGIGTGSNLLKKMGKSAW